MQRKKNNNQKIKSNKKSVKNEFCMCNGLWCSKRDEQQQQKTTKLSSYYNYSIIQVIFSSVPMYQYQAAIDSSLTFTANFTLLTLILKINQK